MQSNCRNISKSFKEQILTFALGLLIQLWLSSTMRDLPMRTLHLTRKMLERCDIHAPTISLPTLCSICSRKSGNGFITIMFALGVNIPSLLANGLLGMPSITLTVMRSWPLQERCLGASWDIQASWELSRTQPHPCGTSFPLRIKRTT